MEFIAPKLGFHLDEPELNLFNRRRGEERRGDHSIRAGKNSDSGFVPKIIDSKLESDT